MNIAETLLPEFDHEMANTRITLERVPNDKLTWKPHPKSWDMAHLAHHLATVPSWGAETYWAKSWSPEGDCPFQASFKEIGIRTSLNKGFPSLDTCTYGPELDITPDGPS